MSTVLSDLRLRLQEAHGVVEAAATCARIGQTSRGAEIANGADDLIMAVERLLAEATRHVLPARCRESDRQVSSDPEGACRAPATAAEDSNRCGR